MSSTFYAYLGTLCWNWNSSPTLSRETPNQQIPNQSCNSYSVPLPKIIQTVSSQCRSAPTKLPLLCKRARLILKFEKFISKLPTYRLTHLPKISFHRFLDSVTSSCQFVFYQLIQQNFPGEILILPTAPKVIWVLVPLSGLRPFQFHSHSHSPLSPQYFMLNRQPFSKRFNSQKITIPTDDS